MVITEVEQPRLSNKTPDPELELEDAKVSIRSAAAAWQERDRASSASRSVWDRAAPWTPFFLVHDKQIADFLLKLC